MTGADAVTDGDGQRSSAVRTDEQVSEAIVRLVATVDGTDPLDLPPLGRSINPDAVDAVFDPIPGGDRGTERSLTLTYHGYEVTVSGTETEQVCCLRDATES
jgi:hypothetical protein